MKERKNMRLRTLVLLTLCLLAAALVEAAPVVIHDAGGEPLAPYIQRLFEEEPSTQKKPPPQSSGQASAPFTLPIKTPEMTPGRVTPRPINQPYMSRPLFMIGTDRLSQQWFVQNRKRLSELNAAGMIVQADSMDGLHTIARLVDGLNVQIMPAPASDIARQLGLKHYPVLIWKNGIEQ
jgi:integrating conjugative element protein (TIGR03765 family)